VENSNYSNSPTKHKHHLLPIITILIITLILTSSFIIFITNSTDSNKPDIPTINPPYTTPQLLWKTQAPSGDRVYPTAVLNEVFYSYHDYTIYGGMLAAINTTNGDIIWQIRRFEKNSDPTHDINNIIYTPYSGITAFSAKDGTIIWKYNKYVTPVVVNDIVYATVGGDEGVVALKAKDGTKLWNTQINNGVLTSPAVANDIVYIGASVNPKLYALDALNGKLLWETTMDSAISSSLVVANGIVYAGSKDHNLYALNATSGEKIWKYKTGGVVGLPVVKYGVVYVGSEDHKVYAINAQTGKKLWTYTTVGNWIGCIPTIAVTDGVVYTTNDYRNNDSTHNDVLYALSAVDGKELWKYSFAEKIWLLDVADNQIYITFFDNVYAFSTINAISPS
jgi:outer membrane protein assembly factor BamB